MKESDKKLAKDFFYRQTISESQFLDQYSGNLSDGAKHIEELIEEAICLKDSAAVEYISSICGYFKCWSSDLVPVYNKLLLEDWHFEHENIVLTLQSAKDPRSVEAVYLTALKELAYLDYDDAYALARKCTWALADINTPEAIEKLKLLAKSDNPYIQLYANKRLAFTK